jgi:hypothetical protein
LICKDVGPYPGVLRSVKRRRQRLLAAVQQSALARPIEYMQRAFLDAKQRATKNKQ